MGTSVGNVIINGYIVNLRLCSFMESTYEKKLVKSLTLLPCFSGGTAQNKISECIVTPINKGQSSLCFDVLHTGKRYFVKYVKPMAGVNAEAVAVVAASNHQLSPSVVYVDDNWLVTVFEAGQSLDENNTIANNKIFTAIDLMAKCHNITVDLPVFDVFSAINKLSKSDNFTEVQRIRIVEAISSIDNISSSKLVFCHGDLNYSNVLVGDKTWLIDYECACLADAEFDLAMFMAINTLTVAEQQTATVYYESKQNVVIDQGRLFSYLQASLLLNGLWYLDKAHSLSLSQSEQVNDELSIDALNKLGLQQFMMFDQISSYSGVLHNIMR